MVQELRGLEVEREVVQFQVDVLKDTLEGVEELLAEAQREAREANMVRQHLNTSYHFQYFGHIEAFGILHASVILSF